MATITLYKDKINGVGSLLDDIIKSSNNLNAEEHVAGCGQQHLQFAGYCR